MNILVIDDDKDSRTEVAEFLKELGHCITECPDGESAWETYSKGNYPMVLSDIKMPRLSGIELLRRITAQPKSNTDVVLFTGHGDMETAIEALRAGAYDYLLKPINVAELAVITERIAEHRSLLHENEILTERMNEEVLAATEDSRQEIYRLKKMLTHASGLDNIGFFSNQMNTIIKQVRRYHQDRLVPVLVEGETGTGKEIIARLIHHGEERNQAPFVDINCAALTANLFESELFGYESGAFTGSLSKGQKGKFDIACGGTLLLDEVGEIPLELQGKLLRAIQEREYYRVGGLKKIKTDVRIICSTNVNLEQKVEQGAFRRDLYYRLKVGHIILPPLRHRKEEILPLTEMFLRQYAKEKKRRFKEITPAAAELLQTHSWPGNIRELKNLIEWSVLMFDDIELKPEHLGDISREKQSLSPITNQSALSTDIYLPPGGFNIEEHYDQIISKALEKYRGNKTAAARYLGISRRSLYCRIKRINKQDNEY